MPARVHIICGSDAAANTKRLAARSTEPALPKGGVLWLVPTRRAAAALRSPLGAAAAAHVLTLQQFADEVVCSNDPDARPLSRTQQRLLVEDLLADMDARGQLPHYRRIAGSRAFAEMVLGFFAELMQSGVTAKQFAGVAQSLSADDRLRQCAALYDEYCQRLHRRHLDDVECRTDHALDLLRSGGRKPFASTAVVFVDGFAEFTPPQRGLLVALTAWVRELWITLPDQPGDERAELFVRPRATLASLAALEPVLEETTGRAPYGRPAGLVHLKHQLFLPRRGVQRASGAAGLLCIEAPGLVGEARMVAREIRQLLDAGIPPAAILVTMRDLAPYADLVDEVFAEYDIPIDVEGAQALFRNPAVAMVLRMLRLPDDDWPFAAVTAVLRSGYFRPGWREVAADPEVAQHSEALLRLLGEPRGRETYLKAVRHWAEKVHAGWEDEQAEESRRQRMHELAKRCGPFLERFFHAWDNAPTRATAEQLFAWLKALAEDLGIAGVANEDVHDRKALARLHHELDQWSRAARSGSQSAGPAADRLLDVGQWSRVLAAVTAEAGVARTARGGARVRVLSADLACGLPADYLFVMGLGERSFPNLLPPVSLLDDQQRQNLREVGLELTTPPDLLPDEMLLFYRLAAAPRRLLALSYPAIDDKGQMLLPSSFLASVRDCFTPDAIPVQRRRMLIEGYDRDRPLSAAELRVWQALEMQGKTRKARFPALHSPKPEWSSDHDLDANLRAAKQLVQARFSDRDFTRFDGWLSDPGIIGGLQQRFGQQHILSPTALESYIACPFKFFLRHVLNLQPLEEPDEEIDSTARGLAFHRALSRLHIHLRAAGVHGPAEIVEDELLKRLDQAVREQAGRASPAGEVLWKLEGVRLQRFGKRYRTHWQKFVQPWHERGVEPRPEFFEVSFGLPPSEGETPHDALVIAMDGIEVRISGRIDRVDVAELPPGQGMGFWVVDYKTGRAANYTAADLQQFRKLQLTLYALAAEQVLLHDRQARPLGMAYWLVTDSGVKLALPANVHRPAAWFDETAAWRKVRQVLQRWVVTLVSGMRHGVFPLKPRSEQCTATCDYDEVCRISQSRRAVESKTWQQPLPTVD